MELAAALAIRFWNSEASWTRSPRTVGSSSASIAARRRSSIGRRRARRARRQRRSSSATGSRLAAAAPDPREREQVVDQRLHPLRAVDGEVDVLVGALVELAAVARLQRLAEARDLAQRLLQVVGGDVGELLELGVGARQLERLAASQLRARGFDGASSSTMRSRIASISSAEPPAISRGPLGDRERRVELAAARRAAPAVAEARERSVIARRRTRPRPSRLPRTSTAAKISSELELVWTRGSACVRAVAILRFERVVQRGELRAQRSNSSLPARSGATPRAITVRGSAEHAARRNRCCQAGAPRRGPLRARAATGAAERLLVGLRGSA